MEETNAPCSEMPEKLRNLLSGKTVDSLKFCEKSFCTMLQRKKHKIGVKMVKNEYFTKYERCNHD